MRLIAAARAVVRRITRRPVTRPPAPATGSVVVSLDERRELAARGRHPAGKARTR